VEDNEVNALLMQAIVALRPGLQLQVAPDVAGALAAARETPPDLVLLDLHLPDGDGYTLLRALRLLPGMQQVPAVVVSASAHAEERQRALAAGFVGYWTKPRPGLRAGLCRARAALGRLTPRARHLAA
jgi:CheY-like chemotaxis protein